MTDSITRHTPYPLTTADRQRVLIALSVTAVVLWAAFSAPVAQWMLTAHDTASTDSGRLTAAHEVVDQGWWAIRLVVLAVMVGSAAVIASRYLAAANWTVTALTCAVRLLLVLTALSMLWTLCTLAAAGVPTI